MEEYKNNAPQLQEDDEFQIDWAGILTKILKHWKQILIIGFVFGVMGIFSALSMKRMYSVQLTLAPEIQGRGSSSLSSMASMLGLGGINMGSTTDAMNITLFPVPLPNGWRPIRNKPKNRIPAWRIPRNSPVSRPAW